MPLDVAGSSTAEQGSATQESPQIAPRRAVWCHPHHPCPHPCPQAAPIAPGGSFLPVCLNTVPISTGRAAHKCWQRLQLACPKDTNLLPAPQELHPFLLHMAAEMDAQMLSHVTGRVFHEVSTH